MKVVLKEVLCTTLVVTVAKVAQLGVAWPAVRRDHG
jgi:hypothetical protein